MYGCFSYMMHHLTLVFYYCCLVSTTTHTHIYNTAQINQDFESQVLQEEWSKYRSSHLQRHNQREQMISQHMTQVQEAIDKFTTHAKSVHETLDNMVDEANSKLVDLEVSLDHDLNRLTKKCGEKNVLDKSPEGQCLDIRAELSHCYNTLGGSGGGDECQIFVQRLDRCVTKALSSK